MPVEKGDTIFVPAEHLGEKKQVVKWSQSMKSREEEYIICKYDNKTREKDEEHSGLIYIQANMLEDFKKKHTQGDQCTVKVDDSFQYGQNKDKKLRWLCFHNKDNKPYQHRFVESTVSKYGNMAAGFAVGLGYKEVNIVGDAIKHFAGDYLHNF